MKTIKTGGRDIRLHNRSRILEYVYMRGQTTKQQLVEALDMSLPTVIQNVKGLLADGLIRETGQLRSTGGRKATAVKSASRADLAKVREWARANGHVVSDRGRISATVQEAYDRANS